MRLGCEFERNREPVWGKKKKAPHHTPTRDENDASFKTEPRVGFSAAEGDSVFGFTLPSHFGINRRIFYTTNVSFLCEKHGPGAPLTKETGPWSTRSALLQL